MVAVCGGIILLSLVNRRNKLGAAVSYNQDQDLVLLCTGTPTLPALELEMHPTLDAMAPAGHIIVDGNEAAARIAHALSEVIAIYPITPASPMGELSDAWSHAGRPNLWGVVPDVVEMQSEAGAAGAVHGALQTGALACTFTASQGLLLMLPNMYKIAGELTPTVFHIAARTIATHALSIFGDHSDVMAARPTGFAMLCSSSVQQAQDLALVAHAATLRSRVPFLHFFDGFRTSHEVATIEPVDDSVLKEMIDEDLIAAHRLRSLEPSRPVIRGTAQNPDVFFQAREAGNLFHDEVPAIVQVEMDRLAAITGRQYRLFDYVGHPEAERVLVLMGSGAGAATEAVNTLVAAGEKVGLVVVRLYRPFAAVSFLEALPATAQQVAVLDRTKEPGAVGDPLYLDVVTTLVERGSTSPLVVGGRYGLSSKEFTPAMAMAVLANLVEGTPRNHFTIGIVDDVTRSSLDWDPTAHRESEEVVRAVFFGLGSDGTVGANKSSVKIVGERTGLFSQGYFVYDSKKSGSRTVSHLRFSPEPIESTYLIGEAGFVACQQFGLLDQVAVVETAAQKATLLLNSPYGPDEVWGQIPGEAQRQIIDKQLDLWVIDAHSVAREAGLGGRVNTVLQTCFFALSGLLPVEEAIFAIKAEVLKAYGKRGEVVVRRNELAIDRALAALHRVEVPASPSRTDPAGRRLPEAAPDFVHRVTAMMMGGRGDLLPVSALPVDGTFPTATGRWEQRSIAHEIPIWDPAICIDCAKCSLVCPHAAIRIKVFDHDAVAGAPAGFATKETIGRDFPGKLLTVQVMPDDCTGCGICVDVCPAISKEEVRHKAINMLPKAPHLERERANEAFFLTIPEPRRWEVKLNSVKGSQLLDPLFESSGACAGCGETPYLKLLSQLLGDRLIVANATGCSSDLRRQPAHDPLVGEHRGDGPGMGQLAVRGQRRVRVGDAARPGRHRERRQAAGHRSPPRDRPAGGRTDSTPPRTTRPPSPPRGSEWPSCGPSSPAWKARCRAGSRGWPPPWSVPASG